jgi:hypothetical protein
MPDIEIPAPENPRKKKISLEKRLDDIWHHHPRVAYSLPVLFLLIGVWCSNLPFIPGIAVMVLAVAAAIMSLRPKMKPLERAVWILALAALTYGEIRAIRKSAQDSQDKTQRIVNGINTQIDLSTQNIAISRSLLTMVQVLSRNPTSSPTPKRELTKVWGAVSVLKSKDVNGAPATAEQPAQIQSGKRNISPEVLGTSIKEQRIVASATIVNDGTNESGNFAKQLEIGLRMAGWQVGGDNIKIGDPEFFPDSLTIEVAEPPSSIGDLSNQEAKQLQKSLKMQGIEATIRFTTLQFPPNFVRIKVSSR